MLPDLFYLMKRILILVLTMATSFGAIACDYCNCYLGLNPGYNKNTIGFRYSYKISSLDIASAALRVTHLDPASPAISTGGTLHETQSKADLFARIYPISKLQVLATLPYAINKIDYNEKSASGKAFDDLSIIAMYQIANTFPTDSLQVRHRLFGGIGVKFPTGKAKSSEYIDIPMADHLYSGTGSTDFLIAASYIGKYRQLGWNLDVNHKFNGESGSGYHHGNTTNVSSRVFYELDIKKVKLFPHISVVFEKGESDKDADVKQPGTGGEVVSGGAGLDVYFGKFSLNTEYRQPLSHNLGQFTPVDKYTVYTGLYFHF